MIKRLDLTSTRVSSEDWPAEEVAFRDRHVFVGRKQYRKLRVMIDFRLLATNPTLPETHLQLLTELLEHPLINTIRYADEGPPPDVAPRPGSDDVDVYEGWAVIRDYLPGRAWGIVLPAGPTGWSLAGVHGNLVDIAERDTRADVYRDLSEPEAGKRRRADALAAQIAIQAVKADVYVTDRPYLHTSTLPVTLGVTLCNPAQALAVLGLYFRAQDVFPIARSFEFDRGLFYWVGARELLPEGWRWFIACLQHAEALNDDSMMVLGASLFQRIQRALETRDRIHLVLNQPQNNNTQDAALAELDVALVLLMGAVDVTARVAHRVVELSPERERVSAWQKRDWLEDVRKQEPQLANVVAPGSHEHHTLTILRLLRNSVHGAALPGITFRIRSQHVESLVGLPDADESTVLSSMEATGGPLSWGAKGDVPWRLSLDPGVFIDRLFDSVLTLLDNLMKHTPVERLPHVRLAPSDVVPPAALNTRGTKDHFAPWIRRSIRWQIGLGSED